MKCLIIIIITIISPLVGRILQMDRAATNTIVAGSKVAQRATQDDPPHDHHHARERAAVIITVGHHLVDIIIVDVVTAVRVPRKSLWEPHPSLLPSFGNG
ncbi:hypothetical protein NUW58_g4174 [Xylaria curta]|uniref:Uncharacterized protein n=1 Tax=Xylaria curta TaxID=42375 RepID=A0ACC1P8H0_9PEZI|nr:hypothetical protein NUW58_g4174 [Xylaria curta]